MSRSDSKLVSRSCCWQSSLTGSRHPSAPARDTSASSWSRSTSAAGLQRLMRQKLTEPTRPLPPQAPNRPNSLPQFANFPAPTRARFPHTENPVCIDVNTVAAFASTEKDDTMKKQTRAAFAIGAATLLGLSACAAGGDDTAAGDAPENKDLSIAVFNGWPEGEAVSFLWKAILEEKGYNVELEYADVTPIFFGLSTGDYDIALDGWLPVT